MRKLLLLTSLLLLNQIIIEAQDKLLVLYGKIQNSWGDTITLSNYYGTYIAVSNKDGEYCFKELIKDPDFLNFSIGSNQLTLFLFSGDTLEMDFDLKNFSNSVIFKGNEAELNKKLLSISLGKPAPNFSLKDVNGKAVNLTDFKGKYVYIDVWSSDCKPCRKEFPFLEALEEKYKDKNIVFIGVSFDRYEETWRKTVVRKGLKGVQLFGNGWKSDFARDYYIEFNPRFILIDTKQRILYLSAPRPSGNIDSVLKNLEGI